MAEGPFFGDAIVVLGPPFEEQNSRELTPATNEGLSGGEWTLIEPRPSEWTVVGPDDGTAVTLGFDGSDWSVRGCGLDMRAPGEVTNGVLTLAGDWVERAAAEPGAGCEGTLWNEAENWKRLFSEGPLIAQDGDTLVLVWAFTPEGETEVSMAFEPDAEFSPQEDGTRDVVKEDLYGFLDEIPASQVPEQDPPAVDVSPADIVRWTGGNRAMQIDAPCSGDQLVTWLLDTGQETLLVGLQGGTEYEFCPESTWQQQDFANALMGSVPTVQMVDGQFVVRGSVPLGMADASQATATLPGVECSADGMPDASVRTGSAPQPVIDTARALAIAARDCDKDTLVEMVQQDETLLALGGPNAEDVFVLPETDAERYRKLLSVLTQGEPVGEQAKDNQPGYFEWVGGPEGDDWRVGIMADGTWSYFLVGG